jgi:hypothetical protein
MARTSIWVEGIEKEHRGVEMDAPVKTAKSTDAPPLPILMKK